MILEGCNETLRMVLLNSTSRSLSYSAGMSGVITKQKHVLTNI